MKKLSNTLRLNFCYLKIIRFLHTRYHPEIIGDILKNVQKTSTSSMSMINENEMRLTMTNRSQQIRHK